MKKIIFIFLSIILVYSYYSNRNTIQEIETINTKLASNDTRVNNNINMDNFKNIKIGDTKAYVISNIGKPSRIDYSEYNFKWYVYNEDLNKFAMVGIEEDNVVALYSNGIDSNEIDIRLNSNRDFVREKYSPLEYKKKGNTRYVINSDDQYDILDIGKNYVTVFYDIHEDNKVCGYQIISKKAESTLNGIYPQGNDRLQESFEAQTKDLVNTERTKNNLNILSYSEKATTSSRKHSEDMMIKNYFDHTNKENKSPFDRMEEEGINYKNALRNFVLRLSKSSMRSPPYIAKSERIPRSGIMTDKRTSPTRRDSRITMVGSTMETACEIRSMDLSVYCRESLRKVSSLEPE